MTCPRVLLFFDETGPTCKNQDMLKSPPPAHGGPPPGIGLPPAIELELALASGGVDIDEQDRIAQHMTSVTSELFPQKHDRFAGSSVPQAVTLAFDFIQVCYTEPKKLIKYLTTGQARYPTYDA